MNSSRSQCRPFRSALLALCLAAAPAACQPSTLEGPVEQSGKAKEADGYAFEPLVTGLERPWSVAWLPGGDMLITERKGTLRVVRDGELVGEPIEGLPAIGAFGQGGLMEVSLHPDFDQNKFVYLTYTEGSKAANRTVLGRGTLDGDRLADFDVVFRVAETKSGGQHFGSRILWLPDDTLLLAIGDGGNPPTRYADGYIRDQAQNPGAHLGKVLRLNDDGTAPSDNPFAEDVDAAAEVYSYGHRNIQGMARDPESGRIYVNEHGARGGDELNIVEPGVNYGWPLVTYSREYYGPRISERTTSTGMRDPHLVWTPSKAPSGLAFYTGDKHPGWKGDLFSGALIHKHVRRVDLDEAGNVLGEEEFRTEKRVRDVRQGPDGHLYVLTDESRGELLRLVRTGG
ncbi:MAG: PQQ-dependent sugar dehydrogenase [Planctomycetota bacterium]